MVKLGKHTSLEEMLLFTEFKITAAYRTWKGVMTNSNRSTHSWSEIVSCCVQDKIDFMEATPSLSMLIAVNMFCIVLQQHFSQETVTKHAHFGRHIFNLNLITLHHVMDRHNVSKKRRKGCWTDCAEYRSVFRGNRRKEEETVMSRNDCVSCPTFFIHPSGPHTNQEEGCDGVSKG